MIDKPPEITWRTIDTAYQLCILTDEKTGKSLKRKFDGQLLRDKTIVLCQLMRDASNAYTHATALVSYNGKQNDVERAAASYHQILQTPTEMEKLLQGGDDDE